MAMKAVVLAAAFSASDAAQAKSYSMKMYDEFRRQFGVKRGEQDQVSYVKRVALFEQRRQEVARHNAQPGISWQAAINKFADYTPGEFTALLGHRPLRRSEGPSVAASAAFLQLKPQAPLAASVDWQMQLGSNISKLAKNQGGCGSCWAVASAGALETHAEAKLGKAHEVSFEQITACTPNPRECGGQGACSGATAELALEYVKEHGVVAKDDYKGYQSGGGQKCHSHQTSSPILHTDGFVKLAENKMQPLMEALATHGPVVVSADAGKWSSYGGGVFDDCEKDATINHAILAMGYGKDKKLDKSFWLIRNSWGTDWGEGGYIRLLRHEEENAHCGVDHKPEEGVACKNAEGEYPATMDVCGMCGILSDSAYPTGVKLVSED